MPVALQGAHDVAQQRGFIFDDGDSHDRFEQIGSSKIDCWSFFAFVASPFEHMTERENRLLPELFYRQEFTERRIKMPRAYGFRSC